MVAPACFWNCVVYALRVLPDQWQPLQLEQLPEKLQETARLRERNPELTLSELALEFHPPVTKSCLNHRLRKLMELAKNL